MVALGYLESERWRGFPGKPAKIYRLTAGPVQISHPMRRYDVLAEALARAVQGLGESGSQAVHAFGATLARPGARSVAAALEPLMEFGAEYEVGPSALECTNCLFAEVCRRAPVICSFHAGLLEGILETSGLAARVEALGFRDPSGCAYAIHDHATGRARQPVEVA